MAASRASPWVLYLRFLRHLSSLSERVGSFTASVPGIGAQRGKRAQRHDSRGHASWRSSLGENVGPPGTRVKSFWAPSAKGTATAHAVPLGKADPCWSPVHAPHQLAPMNIRTLPIQGIAACSLLVLLGAGCAKSGSTAPTQVAAAPTPSVQGVPAQPAPKPAVARVGVPFQPDLTSASWASIKDYTFDQRADFAAGAGVMEASLASQVAELNTKRAALPSTVDTKEWDFAMKNLMDAQSY